MRITFLFFGNLYCAPRGDVHSIIDVGCSRFPGVMQLIAVQSDRLAVSMPPLDPTTNGTPAAAEMGSNGYKFREPSLEVPIRVTHDSIDRIPGLTHHVRAYTIQQIASTFYALQGLVSSRKA